MGLILGAAAALAGYRASAGGRPARIFLGTFGAAWSLLGGAVGVILVLVLFTDHQFMVWNENLFLFNPLALPLAFLIPLSLVRSKGGRATRALALTLVGLGAVGLLAQLLPVSRHQNELFFALVLPVHVGLAFALNRLATTD